MQSILDEKFTLNDLMDPGILKEMCQAFSQCFDLGVTISGEKGEEMVSCCPELEFCRMVHSGAAVSKCADVVKKLSQHPIEGSRVFQIKPFCGMRYAFFPLYHQFELLGRVIIGPFRDPEVPLNSIKSAISAEAGQTVSVDQIEKVPAMSQERLKAVTKLLSKTLEAFLFVNAKRLVTTRLHLETIFSSRDSIFRQMEMQNAGTKEDKEEIEKLKNMF